VHSRRAPEDTLELVAFDPKPIWVKKLFPIGMMKTIIGLANDATMSGSPAACHALGVSVHPPAGARDLPFIPAWTRMPTTTNMANSNISA